MVYVCVCMYIYIYTIILVLLQYMSLAYQSPKIHSNRIRIEKNTRLRNTMSSQSIFSPPSFLQLDEFIANSLLFGIGFVRHIWKSYINTIRKKCEPKKMNGYGFNNITQT